MHRQERGVSEVIAYVLVIGLVLSTVAIVSIAGVGQLRDARNVEQFNNAERAFDLLANNLDDVALRNAPSRSTEISLAQAAIDVAEPIEFRFRGIDQSNAANDFNESYSVWPIHYRSEKGSEQIVYAAGAVFRSAGDGGAILREPALVAENDRLVIPIIHTQSRSIRSRSGGTVQIRAERTTTSLLAADADSTYDTVFVNVTSPRATAWQGILDDHEALSCTMDTSGSTDRVWCTASSPARLYISLNQVKVSLST